MRLSHGGWECRGWGERDLEAAGPEVSGEDGAAQARCQEGEAGGCVCVSGEGGRAVTEQVRLESWKPGLSWRPQLQEPGGSRVHPMPGQALPTGQ